MVGRVEVRDHPADVMVLSRADDVADAEVLVVGEDPVDTVDVAADEVLEAVEA